MNFITITDAEFREFALKSPYKSFMQTPEIAKLREANGWTAYYFAVTEGDEIKAATMAVAKPTFLGKSTYILPGGPLLDLEDTALVNFFFKNLAKYIKSHNGYTLHISPYYELTERDRHGEKIEGGFNHQKAVKNLKNLGFTKLNHPDQPEYLFVMDIKGRTPDQILADFKRNTRNHIKKAEKMGVTIRELKKSELDKLKSITASTAKRRDFTDKPLSYYEQMYDLFATKNEAKFIIAEAEVPDTACLAEHEDSPKATGEVLDTTCSAGHEDLARAAWELLPEGHAVSNTSPLVPMSAAMFMLYGDEVVYLFSGSDEKYMRDYNAQYLIQWHMIKYAAKHNFKVYNFYGINGLPNPNSKDYGIYDFKKGFGADYGRVIELVGSYELSINAPFFALHRFLSKIKHHK